MEKKFSDNEPIEWNNERVDASRLRKYFDLYLEKESKEAAGKKKRFEDLSLEYSQSQIFSPKQKELFNKKLDGMPLTKTEQEYYSRTVKKKVIALANSELHSLARKLIEQS